MQGCLLDQVFSAISIDFQSTSFPGVRFHLENITESFVREILQSEWASEYFGEKLKGEFNVSIFQRIISLKSIETFPHLESESNWNSSERNIHSCDFKWRYFAQSENVEAAKFSSRPGWIQQSPRSDMTERILRLTEQIFAVGATKKFSTNLITLLHEPKCLLVHAWTDILFDSTNRISQCIASEPWKPLFSFLF